MILYNTVTVELMHAFLYKLLIHIAVKSMLLYLGDPAARQQSLERYRDKKARRFNNSTKVRYEMRKVNADKRPRIKGRFVKPEELQTYLRSMPEDLS